MPESRPSPSPAPARRPAGIRRRLAPLVVCCAVAPFAAASERTGTPLPAPVAAQRPPDQVAPAPAGLAAPGWRVERPAQRKRSLARLLARDARAPAPLGRWKAAERHAVAAPAGVPTGAVSGRAAPTTALTSADVGAAALEFALSQTGKPYRWGASGPGSYDCSGLTQRSYASVGVLLPRVAAEQAQVGKPVGLADLAPGDLLFWAYDPTKVATVHHVAMYAGGGYLVHAPQTGDVVRVAPVWLDGYAGAVRVSGLIRASAVGLGGGVALPGAPPFGTLPGATPLPPTLPAGAAGGPPGPRPPGSGRPTRTTSPPATRPPSTPPSSSPPSSPPPSSPPPASTPPPSSPPPTTSPPPTSPPATTPPPTTPTSPTASTPTTSAATATPTATTPTATATAPTAAAPTTAKSTAKSTPGATATSTRRAP